MNCTDTRALMSSYVDGEMTGRQMGEVHEHISDCNECGSQYLLLKRTQDVVATLGRKQAPPDLALRIRVALSQEAARKSQPWYESIRVRFENTLNAFLVPATAGTLSAIVVFGLLIGYFAAPPTLQADTNDVPTALYTPPELKYTPFDIGVGPLSDAVVVEAYVDANGRITDYKVLSAPEDLKDQLPELNNMLLFAQFRPATSFGQPTAGRAVLSFARVNVRG